MNFCDRERVASTFRGKTVALVGSGPGSKLNPPGKVDAHDIVVRVNNYKLFAQTGFRTDVFYSYFGNAIRKTPWELKRDGVTLCMCKCPDAQFIESEWHRAKGKMVGVDFRWIYQKRADWWFCKTYVPTVAEFLEHFHLLGDHVPTTGFSALLDILRYEPASVYMTGFDFFVTGIHNVDERWRAGDPSDPIGHVPGSELEWLRANVDRYPIELDATAIRALAGELKPIQPPKPHRGTKKRRIR